MPLLIVLIPCSILTMAAYFVLLTALKETNPKMRKFGKVLAIVVFCVVGVMLLTAGAITAKMSCGKGCGAWGHCWDKGDDGCEGMECEDMMITEGCCKGKECGDACSKCRAACMEKMKQNCGGDKTMEMKKK